MPCVDCNDIIKKLAVRFSFQKYTGKFSGRRIYVNHSYQYGKDSNWVQCKIENKSQKLFQTTQLGVQALNRENA